MGFAIIFLGAVAANAQVGSPRPVSVPLQAAAPLTPQPTMDEEPMPESFNPGGFGACYPPGGKGIMAVRVAFGRSWSFRAGAPYPALVATEEVPPPGSSQPESHSESYLYWRDSSGRVRIQPQGQTLGSDCPNILVQIEDPVAGHAYVLDTLHKIAHRIPVHFAPQQGTGPARDTVRPDGETVVTQLIGSKTISGLAVTVTQRIRTCPTGFVRDLPKPRPRGECLPEAAPGIMAPAADTSEYWSSSKLGMSIYAKHTDHKGNTSTTTLQTLQLIEPDPALFTVAAEYQIVDEGLDTRSVTFTIPLPLEK